MASTAQGKALTEAHRLAQIALGKSTVQEFRTAWSQLDATALEKSFPAYSKAARLILDASRTKSTALAEVYLRTFHAAETGKVLRSADVSRATAVVEEQIATSLYVTGPVAARQAMSRGAPVAQAMATAFVQSAGAMTRHTLSAGRETVRETALANDGGWARVTGRRPCYFCAMLASRGAVYRSDGTADFSAHDHCGCAVEPAWGSGYELNPDAQRFRNLYADSTGDAKGKGKVAAFRNAYEKDTPPARRRKAKLEADAPTPAPARTAGPNLAAMTNDELDEAVANAWAAGDQEAADRLMVEMDSREAARAARPASRSSQYTEQSTFRWTDDDFDREVTALMQPDANGWVDQEAVDQLAFLMDKKQAQDAADAIVLKQIAEEKAERIAARKALDKKSRRKPHTADEELRSDYETYIHTEWLKAEDQCNGVLLNRAGKAAGIDPRTLWQGNTARARKYASEELKTFWQRHGRINFSTFRADALGRRSDRAAREATTKEGWYDAAG